MEIHNRIVEALNIKNMKPIELSEKTKISKASISSYCKQRWQPKQDALYKMAKVLDVSELWLAGYDVPMARPQNQKTMDIQADIITALKQNPKYIEIMKYIINLDDKQLKTVELMLKGLYLN